MAAINIYRVVQNKEARCFLSNFFDFYDIILKFQYKELTT